MNFFLSKRSKKPSPYELHLEKLYSNLSSCQTLICLLHSKLEDSFIKHFSDSEKGEISSILANIEQIASDNDSLTTSILALYRPVGMDLRLCVSSIKIMLYMSILSTWIFKTIKLIQKTKEHIPNDLKQIFLRMNSASNQCIKNSIFAIVSDGKSSVDISSGAMESEEIVNNLYRNIKRDAKNKIKTGTAKEVSSLYEIIQIAKNLERMSDYSVAILKRVYYIKTGHHE